jgi:hypothetical protein
MTTLDTLPEMLPAAMIVAGMTAASGSLGRSTVKTHP